MYHACQELRLPQVELSVTSVVAVTRERDGEQLCLSHQAPTGL